MTPQRFRVHWCTNASFEAVARMHPISYLDPQHTIFFHDMMRDNALRLMLRFPGHHFYVVDEYSIQLCEKKHQVSLSAWLVSIHCSILSGAHPETVDMLAYFPRFQHARPNDLGGWYFIGLEAHYDYYDRKIVHDRFHLFPVGAAMGSERYISGKALCVNLANPTDLHIYFLDWDELQEETDYAEEDWRHSRPTLMNEQTTKQNLEISIYHKFGSVEKSRKILCFSWSIITFYLIWIARNFLLLFWQEIISPR